MKTSSSALLPILRSDAVGELLARLYLSPERPWTLSALAQDARVSLPTATREVTRMVAAGLLLEERVGKTRQVRVNPDALLYPSLRELVSLTYGPVPVIQSELGRVGGVDRAFIFGSWAARHEGVQGSEPRDIDVLVVGNPDPEDLYEAGDQARKRLRRDVNIRTISELVWDDPHPTDPFLQHVRANPLVELRLGTVA